MLLEATIKNITKMLEINLDRLHTLYSLINKLQNKFHLIQRIFIAL